MMINQHILYYFALVSRQLVPSSEERGNPKVEHRH